MPGRGNPAATAFLSAGLVLAALAAAGCSPQTAASQPRWNRARGRRPPVVTVGAHIIFATATILLALLTATGVS
jgi:hypothetical protein